MNAFSETLQQPGPLSSSDLDELCELLDVVDAGQREFLAARLTHFFKHYRVLHERAGDRKVVAPVRRQLTRAIKRLSLKKPVRVPDSTYAELAFQDGIRDFVDDWDRPPTIDEKRQIQLARYSRIIDEIANVQGATDRVALHIVLARLVYILRGRADNVKKIYFPTTDSDKPPCFGSPEAKAIRLFFRLVAPELNDRTLMSAMLKLQKDYPEDGLAEHFVVDRRLRLTRTRLWEGHAAAA